MPKSVRERLEDLNEECKAFCRDYRGSKKWQPFGDSARGRHPNFLLAYSSVDTFERPGGIMIVGTNPSGDHTFAHRYPVATPFDPDHPRWSSYLDDDWGNGSPGEDYVQLNVRRIAAIIAGGPMAGDELLRSIPTGNLIPFRSWTKRRLPLEIHDPAAQGNKYGLEIGWGVISVAQPRTLILLASDKSDWEWLMAKVQHDPEPDSRQPFTHNGRTYTFREANQDFGSDWPDLVLALPTLNSSSEDLRELHPRVLQHFDERVTYHGLTHA